MQTPRAAERCQMACWGSSHAAGTGSTPPPELAAPGWSRTPPSLAMCSQAKKRTPSALVGVAGRVGAPGLLQLLLGLMLPLLMLLRSSSRKLPLQGNHRALKQVPLPLRQPARLNGQMGLASRDLKLAAHTFQLLVALLRLLLLLLLLLHPMGDFGVQGGGSSGVGVTSRGIFLHRPSLPGLRLLPRGSRFPTDDRPLTSSSLSASSSLPSAPSRVPPPAWLPMQSHALSSESSLCASQCLMALWGNQPARYKTPPNWWMAASILRRPLLRR